MKKSYLHAIRLMLFNNAVFVDRIIWMAALVLVSGYLIKALPNFIFVKIAACFAILILAVYAYGRSGMSSGIGNGFIRYLLIRDGDRIVFRIPTNGNKQKGVVILGDSKDRPHRLSVLKKKVIETPKAYEKEPRMIIDLGDGSYTEIPINLIERLQ